MGLLPSSRIKRLNYFNSRVDTWVANATQIGLTPAQASAFKILVETALSKNLAAEQLRNQSKAATQSYYEAADDAITPGRAYLATIKAYAEATGNPNVYALAEVDPPAPPTPAPVPAVPENVVGTISPTGSVTLNWEATPSGASSGIFFLVGRKRGAETTYTVIGGTPLREFFDPAPDVCDGPVSYQVRAQRGQLSSNWSVPITFDVSNGPGLNFVVASEEQTTPKREAA